MKQRAIAIIGAGEAGLKLGLGLLKSGHLVSIFTNKSAKSIQEGGILSSQGVFDSALQIDRRLGINYWDASCPQNTSITFSLADSKAHKQIIYFQGKTSKPYQSVDQRLKFSFWMNEFERIGGKLHIKDVGLEELDHIAKWHELTIVAGGKGEISKSFPIHHVRSHFDKPQRALACIYIHGVKPEKFAPGIHANILPGIGEFFMMPGLTLSGPCEMMLFEGIPGGIFDCWQDITKPKQRLEKALGLLSKYLPWEAERCKDVVLTDHQATLVGRYTPIIRQPTFKLPCGKNVFGIGDTLVLNDPIAGQGANNATKAADIYLKRICEQGEKLFDELWMRETFELYWKLYGKWSTKWTHLLLMPPAPHIVEFLTAASKSPKIAKIIADGFDDPSNLFPWIMSQDDTLKIIHDVTKTKAPRDDAIKDKEFATKIDAEESIYDYRP